MNCKPGDLAIVIIGDRGTNLHLGSIVKTTHTMNLGYGVCWKTVPVLYGTDGAKLHGMICLSVPSVQTKPQNNQSKQ